MTIDIMDVGKSHLPNYFVSFVFTQIK